MFGDLLTKANRSMKTIKLPETIDRSTVLLVFGLIVFSGMIGFAFGADAGYAKGFQDGSQSRTVSPIPLQMP